MSSGRGQNEAQHGERNFRARSRRRRSPEASPQGRGKSASPGPLRSSSRCRIRRPDRRRRCGRFQGRGNKRRGRCHSLGQDKSKLAITRGERRHRRLHRGRRRELCAPVTPRGPRVAKVWESGHHGRERFRLRRSRKRWRLERYRSPTTSPSTSARASRPSSRTSRPR